MKDLINFEKSNQIYFSRIFLLKLYQEYIIQILDIVMDDQYCALKFIQKIHMFKQKNL